MHVCWYAECLESHFSLILLRQKELDVWFTTQRVEWMLTILLDQIVT